MGRPVEQVRPSLPPAQQHLLLLLPLELLVVEIMGAALVGWELVGHGG